MNRLTKRTKGGLVYTEIPLNQSLVIDKDGYIAGGYTGFVADRLADYEDTGLELEQVKQLNDAFTNSQKKLEKAFDDLLKYKDLEEQLFNKYDELRSKPYSDIIQNYTTGYKYGHRNGQLELLEQILNIETGRRQEEAERESEANNGNL